MSNSTTEPSGFPIRSVKELRPSRSFLRPKVRQSDLPIVRPGHCLVIRNGAEFHDGASIARLAWAGAVEVYEIVASPKSFSLSVQVPCLGDAANFNVSVDCVVRVTAPVDAARNPVEEVVDVVLRRWLERELRSCGRTFELEQTLECEQEIGRRLSHSVSTGGPLVDHGIEVQSCFAKVTLDDVAAAHLARRRSATLETVTWEEEQKLIDLREDRRLERERSRASYWQGVLKEGEVAAAAHLLAQSPDDLRRTIDLMRADRTAVDEANLRRLEAVLKSGVWEDPAHATRIRSLINGLIEQINPGVRLVDEPVHALAESTSGASESEQLLSESEALDDEWDEASRPL